MQALRAERRQQEVWPWHREQGQQGSRNEAQARSGQEPNLSLLRP